MKDLDIDHKTLFNYLDHLKDLDRDHATLFDYLKHLKVINASIHKKYLKHLSKIDNTVHFYYRDHVLPMVKGGAINSFLFNFYFHYLIYTFIVKNPYTEIIHDIITIPEFQEVISNDNLTELFVNMGDNSLIELVRKFTLNIARSAAVPKDLMVYLKDKGKIHPANIIENGANITYEKIQFNKDYIPTDIEINILDFIPIFTLCAKLYNKYQNKGDDVISRYLRLNDITNGEQFIKTNMPDPSEYNKEMLNIYILNMIFTVYYLLLLEQVIYCINYNNSIMNYLIKKYRTLTEIFNDIPNIINGNNEYKGMKIIPRLEKLIENLKNSNIDQTIIEELNNLRGINDNNKIKQYLEEVKNKTNTDKNGLWKMYNNTVNDEKIKISAESICKSIAEFNGIINSIFNDNNKYNTLLNNIQTEQDQKDWIKDVTIDNYYDKIKDLVKSIKQIQYNLLENVFKIDKETIKQKLQYIFYKLGLCNEYNDAVKNSTEILDPLNDVKFTNSFKSLVDNLTAQSEDFQNIYKSNINKFNNIILQNISILTEKH